LRPIEEREGWKLITLTKASGPIADVINYYHRVVHTSCGIWRQEEFDKVKSIHPDLVIASSLDSYLMRSPMSGTPTTSETVWAHCMQRSLMALRAGARQVVLLRALQRLLPAPRTGRSGPFGASLRWGPLTSARTPRMVVGPTQVSAPRYP